jgi:hypothetical protein
MVRGIRAQPALDVRELVLQRASTVAVHNQENRPTPEEIQANYVIDQAIRDPVPQIIGLFDDVLHDRCAFPRGLNRASAVVSGRDDRRVLHCPPRARSRGLRGF